MSTAQAVRQAPAQAAPQREQTAAQEGAPATSLSGAAPDVTTADDATLLGSVGDDLVAMSGIAQAALDVLRDALGAGDPLPWDVNACVEAAELLANGVADTLKGALLVSAGPLALTIGAAACARVGAQIQDAGFTLSQALNAQQGGVFDADRLDAFVDGLRDATHRGFTDARDALAVSGDVEAARAVARGFRSASYSQLRDGFAASATAAFLRYASAATSTVDPRTGEAELDSRFVVEIWTSLEGDRLVPRRARLSGLPESLREKVRDMPLSGVPFRVHVVGRPGGVSVEVDAEGGERDTSTEIAREHVFPQLQRTVGARYPEDVPAGLADLFLGRRLADVAPALEIAGQQGPVGELQAVFGGEK